MDRGFFYWDDGQFMFGAQPGALWLRHTLSIDGWPRLFAERAPFDSVPVPYAAFSAKPAYDFLMIVWGAFLGLTPDSLGFLSLLLGVGSMGLIFRIARKAFDDRIAIGAAFLLAVSGYHVYYSASQGSFVAAGFFLLAGTSFYVDWLQTRRRSRLMLAGATLAIAWGCHYNSLLPFLVAFAGLELLWLWQSRRSQLRGALVSTFLFGASFLAVIVGFELFYRALVPAAYDHIAQIRSSYLEQLRFVLGVYGVTRPSGFDRFPSFLLDSEGAAVCGLALLGWMSTAWLAARQPVTAALLALSGVHFLASLAGGAWLTPVFSRVTVVLLPFVALWGAVGVDRLAVAASRLARLPAAWMNAAAVALLCALALPRAYGFAHLTSGHAEAAQYVLTHGNGKQMVLGLPVEQYDLGSFEGTYPVPLSFDEMRKLHQEAGVRLLVLDLRVHILEEWGHPLGPALRELENRFTPVATIPSTAGATLVLAGENAQARESLERTLRDPRSGQIRIYDLAAVFDR